jgi:hypothetical protein
MPLNGNFVLLLYYSISKFSKGLLKNNKNLKLWTREFPCGTITTENVKVGGDLAQSGRCS